MISPSDRQTLARVLGMLGSSNPGERENAARLAERLRRSSGLSWAELLNLPAVPPEPAAAEPAQQPSPVQPAPAGLHQRTAWPGGPSTFAVVREPWLGAYVGLLIVGLIVLCWQYR